MATGTGISSQFGYVAETTWGTPLTVTRFVPIIDETVSLEIEQLESEGIFASQHVLAESQWAQGLQRVSGDIGLEMYDRSIGLLMKHALGSVTSSGTTTCTHTFTVADLTGLGLTMQFGRPDRGGTVRPFTYAGVKVESWEIACAAGEIATMGLTVVGKSETTATSLATASYATGIAPMTWAAGSFTLGGSSLCVRSFRIGGENPYDTDRTCIGQSTIDEPLLNGLREITGEAEVEFPDLIQYNRFVAGTTASLVVTLAKGTSTLSMTANVRTDGETPHISGRDTLVHTLSFKALRTNTADSSAFTMVLVNSDSTP